jgi:hypothetical protein
MVNLSGRVYDVVGSGILYERTFYRDEKCHEDYVEKLIPRAVGYSAGLLNYFFRGSIDIIVPINGIYSMIDATQPGFDPSTAAFTTIKLRAKNITPNEDMTNGTFHLVVKYRLAQADTFQPGPVQTSEDFFYIVAPEKNGRTQLSRTSYTELIFDLTEPISLWATDVYLQVVFKGKLGNEENAVAVGFRDISEPTPVQIFNNMDKICIYGSWYEAGSPEAIAQVDANQNGIADYPSEADIYAHHMDTFYLKFAPYSETSIPIVASPTVYDFKVPFLAAGDNLTGSYILSDYGFDYSIYRKALLATDPNDPWPHNNVLSKLFRYAIKRQTDYVEDNEECGGPPSCYIDIYPELIDDLPELASLYFYDFRGVLLWYGGQIIYSNSSYPAGSQCSYDDL